MQTYNTSSESHNLGYESIFNLLSRLEAFQIKSIHNLLSLSEAFQIIYEHVSQRIPYHINVIDELHINENGHSRILTKLLQYVNSHGEYEILQSLIDYIRNTKKISVSEFNRINIKEPIITQETQRIDLWVREPNKNYAIIIENKIYNAQDQDAQLERYIEKTISDGFSESNIFIIYLSNDGKEPDKQSWGNYENLFKNRYINLSFRDNIIEWLKQSVLPFVRIKDIYLQSAIQQYIDYLEGLFYLRTIQKNINMNLENFITEHFAEEMEATCKNDKECLNFFKEKRKEIDNLSETISRIETKYRNNIFESFSKKIKVKYDNKIGLSDSQIYKDCFVHVTIPYDGKEIVVLIASHGTLFCQIEYNRSITPDKEVHNFLNSSIAQFFYPNLLPEKNDWCIWKYFKSSNEIENIEQAFSCFEEVVKKCIEFTTKH